MNMAESKVREQWSKDFEFVLALIGFAVGLGTIWRFPYICYDSGGGAFLVAYLIMWFFCGMPLLYMELAIGQHTKRGPIGALSKLCPISKGVGFASVIRYSIILVLYIIMLVWSFYFLFNSFKKVLPWSNCDNKWNSIYCTETGVNSSFSNTSSMVGNGTNITISSSAEYFRNHVLQLTGGIDNLGTVRWEFALILFFCWFLMYFSVFKGTRSVGKVVYVTVLFPYLVLIILIVRGCTLPGSSRGIAFLFKPKWKKLMDPKVWVGAAAQNFISLGIGSGGNITLASYNKKETNILRFTVIVGIVDLLSSIMAGVSVFSNLGYLAQHQGKDIHEVVNSGIELAFVVFPDIFTTMPFSQLFSSLFYLMLLTVAMDSLHVGPKVIVTVLMDQFNNLPRQEIVCIGVCALLYFLSFPTITQGGIYYFSLLDYYGSFGTTVSLAFFEVMAIAWIYGGKKLARDILDMNGTRTHFTIILCWKFVCPLLIMAIWVLNITRYKPFVMGSYVFPTWAVVCGWIIGILPLTCLPICVIHSVYKAPGNFILEKLRNSLKPRTKKTKAQCTSEESRDFLETIA